MAYDKLTASRMAKQLQIPVKDVFQVLLDEGLAEKNNGNWALTPEGIKAGGEECRSKHGTYLIWPPEIFSRDDGEEGEANGKQRLLTSTALGHHFGVSATRMNRILNEMGWIDKGVKGWKITEQGKRAGGYQRQHHQSGVPFVVWPETILEHEALAQRTAEDQGSEPVLTKKDEKEESFRGRFPATHRTSDGHLVRSRAEMLIDNWLYMNEVVHAYERKVPISEDVYSDFYIPTGKVFIEFWGMESDPKYVERKTQKLEIYKKYRLNLIELHDKDIENLDDILPRELLRFDIQTF